MHASVSAKKALYSAMRQCHEPRVNTTLLCEGKIKSNQINIRLIGKISQLTQTQKWFT